jgi:hypothetical protein
LKVRFNAVFDEAWVKAELVGVIAMDFVDVDHQQIGCFVVDHLPHFHDTLCPNVVVRSENLH